MAKSVMLVVIFLISASSSADAQSASAVTLSSYERARDILEASMKALGGREALRKTEQVYVREIGTAPMLFQSQGIAPPFDVWKYETIFAFDIPGAKVYEEYKFRNPKSDYVW